jgi:hypothetical protein
MITKKIHRIIVSNYTITEKSHPRYDTVLFAFTVIILENRFHWIVPSLKPRSTYLAVPSPCTYYTVEVKNTLLFITILALFITVSGGGVPTVCYTDCAGVFNMLKYCFQAK